MFEPGFDQAAGLRGDVPGGQGGAVLMPVASPAQPARAYELLCTLASGLAAEGRAVIIVDGTATETPGAPLGLVRVLQDPSIAHLERATDGADWLVMPGARGLQMLLETAHAGGAEIALSRLLAPFAPGALVLLFAPAFTLAALLEGVAAHVLVPVIEQPQSSIDAYGAAKLLHTAGLTPALAPLASGAPAALQTVVNVVTDTAQRHLGLPLEAWPAHTWAQRVQECALERPRPRHTHGYHHLVPHAVFSAGQPAHAHPLWS